MGPDGEEEKLQQRQDGRLYPLGRVLRSTFDADNHDTLGSDVTGLMIDLSKLPDVGSSHPTELLPAQSHVRPSILSRLSNLLRR